jgi:hypothetical protein
VGQVCGQKYEGQFRVVFMKNRDKNRDIWKSCVKIAIFIAIFDWNIRNRDF